MTEKELETTGVELDAERYGLRASATRTVFDGFSRGLHRGPGRCRRGARADPAAARTRATPRRVEEVEPDPALHRAAAALHRGDPDQGPRGARHRPAVDLCRHHLDDPRSRLRQRQGAPPSTRAGRRDRDRPAGRALRRARRPRVHRAHGGGPRRGRQRQARVGAPRARLLHARSRPRSTSKRDGAPAAATSRLSRPTRSARKATRW